MKHNDGNAKKLIVSYIFIFGVLQIIFIVRNLLPVFSGFGGLRWGEIIISLLSAAIFSISHLIITSEHLDTKMSVKRRIILCGIPCTLIGCVLSGEFGIQSLLPHIADTALASIMWIISYLVSIGVYIAIFFLIELKFRKQGYKYNLALEKYKKDNH